MKTKKTYLFHILCIIYLSYIFITHYSFAADKPSSEILILGDTSGYEAPPYLQAYLDYAGYSDVINYGPSPEHPYDYHELLSGEWGAAIYYNGIKDDPKAMWLTDYFKAPDWSTYNDFYIKENPGIPVGAWHDPNNPTPLNNTGRSVIYNDQVEIQIDYEVVDLEFRDPNIYRVRSPMAVWDEESGRSGYVNSDRYVFLQTYSITNKTKNDSTVENIEFYQMLHSHGADDYGQSVTSVYRKFKFDDPLESYTLYNPIHQVGNFRYDITQWNDPDHPDSFPFSTPHKDWAGFSCTVNPNWIECGNYRTSEIYSKGTHKNIENRNLNEESEIFYDEVAGAMGWYLGSLEPVET